MAKRSKIPYYIAGSFFVAGAVGISYFAPNFRNNDYESQADQNVYIQETSPDITTEGFISVIPLNSETPSHRFEEFKEWVVEDDKENNKATSLEDTAK